MFSCFNRSLIVLAVATASFTAVVGPRPALADDGDGPVKSTLNEIIVTATRRAEPVSKVGEGISVVTTDQLDTLSANSLEDFVQLTPGPESAVLRASSGIRLVPDPGHLAPERRS